ncbi:Uncharacterised protein [Mycobacteroides abscessus subsp. abscessus]|nr:hypothetical protein MABM_10310 [Mycobacteroides abscessus]SKT09876.1 Uncharacterised protein [Mycobacteroides abscessus subsp. abscessus]
MAGNGAANAHPCANPAADSGDMSFATATLPATSVTGVTWTQPGPHLRRHPALQNKAETQPPESPGKVRARIR